MRLLFLALPIAVLQLVRGLPPTSDQFLLLFGNYLESLRAQAAIPGLAVAIVGDNGVLWERAFGQQDLERSIAARTDTPFHLDGLTQIFTASIVLRCVEEGRLSLDDRIGKFDSDNPDANATIREVLTHTTALAGGLAFSYHPERLEPLRIAIRRCTENSYRETLANLLNRLAMVDSVPGVDAIHLVPPAEGVPDAPTVERYTAVLNRLASPYAVDVRGRAIPSQGGPTTVTPLDGLVSTVLDFAKFDLALRQGILIRAETLAEAWRAPVGRQGEALPHGLGWFVQTYNGEAIVWQFGVSPNAYSSLVVTIPGRGLTLVMLANSDGLAKPSTLAGGDVSLSPFARLFLRSVIR
jgi:CubicO group peptidase (beta-lactamase class C family)